MWVGKDQFNSIAYPLDGLPSISSKRDLVFSLNSRDLAARREEADDLLDELRSEVGDPEEGSGYVGQQVDDDTIERVDWLSVIVDGDFQTIRSANEWWRIDLAEILDDLLWEAVDD